MALRINHNIAAMNSHRNLQIADNMTAKSLQKLSSGMKVNIAADGPAALVISEQMRAQIAGLNQAVSNSETAVSLVQTAEGALNEANNTLVSMRQLAIHAANEGANDSVMLEADQAEIINALETIDRISSDTQFGTKRLLNGSRGANGVTQGDNLEFVGASAATNRSPVGGFDITVTQTATRANKESTEALTQEAIDAGEKITVVENGKTVQFETEAGVTAKHTVDRLNVQLEKAGLAVKAELSEGDKVGFTHDEYGSEHSFLVASSTVGFLSAESNVTEPSVAGLDVKGNIAGWETDGKGQVLTGKTGTVVADLEVAYRGTEEIENEQGVRAGSVTVAQNSLVFQVGANEDQTVKVAIRETASNKLGRGMVNDSNFNSLEEVDVRSAQGAQDSLRLIDSAINEVSSIRASLGAFQKNTLETNLSNLRVTTENLTNAESVIRDADVAQEMATFTKNQIMNNASTAMLAQANQQSQSVLSLIQ